MNRNAAVGSYSHSFLTTMCGKRIWIIALIIYNFGISVYCYEKTLRKIVRNQSKMIQTPFSHSLRGEDKKYSQLKDYLLFSGSHLTSVNNVYKSKTPTNISFVEIGRNIHNKLLKMTNFDQYERLTRNTLSTTTDTQLQNRNNVLFHDENSPFMKNFSQSGEIILEEISKIPAVPYFSSANKETVSPDGSTSVTLFEEAATLDIDGLNNNNTQSVTENGNERQRLQVLMDQLPKFTSSSNSQNFSMTCDNLLSYKVSLDIREKIHEFDISPSWLKKENFWNKIYNNRYEFLMKNPDWPSLKVILVPRTYVSSVWLKPFESFHNETVHKIITNMIKKLQFYPNLTFVWNEVSHLSTWWKSASQKRRLSLRRLIREGRFEITTGGWVETDEATSSLFGILHQFTEGHIWLEQNLKYQPKVAWLTNSVTHSSTFPYILSSIGIYQLIFTNIHFSLEEYFAEYQYSDFIWVQNWETDDLRSSELNKNLKKIGKDQLPKHSVLTHYLQFNSDNFKACGPQSNICENEYNFANKVNDVKTYNVKDKSESLLEQYSKTGTLSPHNIILAPIGGSTHYEAHTEFDYQYSNYMNIADFINVNQNIYKATMQFGTPKDYFQAIVERHQSYPTVKGDFLTFAEIIKERPAYWTGFFTTRPMLKILLRRIQATLRSTELLFTFASSLNKLSGFNNSDLAYKLQNAREIVARLQDRNVVGGTLPANMLKYVYNQILLAAKDCWYIQEVSASLLSSKPDIKEKYLSKYVYRDGEFISSFKSVDAGDQLYIFNSLSHERTEIIELMTRNMNIRIIDYNNKEITYQINPIWKYSAIENIIRINDQFYKIVFVVNIPPMTLQLYKFGESFASTFNMATIYCISCSEDSAHTTKSFNIQALEPGDIQIENYRIRLIFDEFTGFLKTVIKKETNTERQILINYGAFRSSEVNSGMFLFNTNTTNPMYDILKQYTTADKKTLLIVSGNVVTDFTSIYGNLLCHTVRICNILNNALSGIIRIDSKVDFEISPKNRELEMFMAIQTDISNGNLPEIYLDNNGFQVTSHKINISRNIEANMYPVTSMAFIQDEKIRMSVVTDHAQGVTALQEGQILFMLDRRVLFSDARGVNEGLADSTATNHIHYLLLENIIKQDESLDKIEMPSFLALQVSNIVNYPLDVFFIDKSFSDVCYYGILPLVKNSFPCDVDVVNFRMMLDRKVTRKYIPNSAILTLHRLSFTCNIDNSVHFQCNHNNKFVIEKIIQNIKAVYHSNLVGTVKDCRVTKAISKINFPPMELMTMKMFFEI